jgi:hypothetical protein
MGTPRKRSRMQPTNFKPSSQRTSSTRFGGFFVYRFIYEPWKKQACGRGQAAETEPGRTSRCTNDSPVSSPDSLSTRKCERNALDISSRFHTPVSHPPDHCAGASRSGVSPALNLMASPVHITTFEQLYFALAFRGVSHCKLIMPSAPACCATYWAWRTASLFVAA